MYDGIEYKGEGWADARAAGVRVLDADNPRFGVAWLLPCIGMLTA